MRIQQGIQPLLLQHMSAPSAANRGVRRAGAGLPMIGWKDAEDIFFTAIQKRTLVGFFFCLFVFVVVFSRCFFRSSLCSGTRKEKKNSSPPTCLIAAKCIYRRISRSPAALAEASTQRYWGLFFLAASIASSRGRSETPGSSSAEIFGIFR